MRELKFRVWNPNANRFEAYSGVINMPLHEVGAVTLKVPVYEVMQYTGLKDKNGVEIYEGDILLDLPRKMFTDSKQSERYGKVYWKEDRACFGLFTYRIDDRQVEYDEPFPMVGIEKHEVIGNIYENPDLLTKS